MMRPGCARPIHRRLGRTAAEACTECTEAAEEALAAGLWNAAGLMAVYAGIAAWDAVLITSGARCLSGDSRARLRLLRSRVPGLGASQRRQVLALLESMDTVAYSSRLLTEAEARRLLDNAQRLRAWAARVVSANVE